MDGVRVLVTRYYPRGVKKTKFHRWYREVAPSSLLLKSLKEKQISKKKYIKFYLREMNNPKSLKAIRTIKELLFKGHNVTLLCIEKEGKFCHRHILKEIIVKKWDLKKTDYETCKNCGAELPILKSKVIKIPRGKAKQTFIRFCSSCGKGNKMVFYQSSQKK